MLKITKYYKTIFFGFIQSNFVSTETQSVVDRLSDSANKKSFMRNNVDEISSYLDTLDSNKDGTIIMGHITNPKLTELFKELGIKPEQLQHGITLDELKKELKALKIYTTHTKGITTTEVHYLRKVVDTNVFKRTLKKGMTGTDVMNLQQFLVSKGLLKAKRASGKTNIDYKFGGDTRNALIKYQEKIYGKGHKFADGVLTLGGKTLKAIINENSDGRFNSESATAKDVLGASEQANEGLDANINKLKISKEFFAALEAREDGGARWDTLSDMGSGLGWIREIFGKNNASEYFNKLNIEGKFKGAFDKVNDPKMQEKFNKGYEYLVQDSSTRNRSLALYGFRDLLMVAFAGVPIFDIKANFIKRLEGSGVDMNRALLFTKWAKSGMKQSFEKYEKEVGPTLNTGENLDRDLNKLKATVSAYIRTHHADKVKNGKVTKELIAQLRKTDTKLDELITTYINDRFIPDAETLLSGGFNVFEYFFDEKYDKIKELISELKGEGIKLNTKNKARKVKSSSEKNQDVFLLKNNGKFYLHIGSEYKEFTDKRPSSEEIESSILEYNNLSLTTHGRSKSTISSIKYLPYSIKGKKIIAEAKRKGIKPDLTIHKKENNGSGWYRENLDDSKNEVFISEEARIKIAHEIMDEFRKQNTKSKDNTFGAGKLDGHIEQVEDRLDYYTVVDKNSKVLKEAIKILKAGKDIPKEVGENFGLINKYNSTADFLNAYSALPEEVKAKIAELDHSKLTPEEYVSKLQELTKTPGVKEALTAIKSGPKAYEKYRLAELESRLHLVDPEHRIDAGRYKYGARILSKEEFNKPYSELQAEYKIRYEKLHKKYPQKKEIKQEFKKSFKEIYSFDKPNTGDKTADYNTYLDKLSKTGPHIAEETDGKYWSTMDYQERGLIEQGIYDITGEQLTEAIKTRGEDIKIEDYFVDPGKFINTARQAGTKHDKKTTFKALAEERGDKYIKHVAIDRSYSLITKSGENVKIDVTYDVYDRPECQNVYVLPNSKSIQRTIKTLKQNNNVSILKTPSFPLSLISMFTKGGIIFNGTIAQGGGTTPPPVINPGPIG